MTDQALDALRKIRALRKYKLPQSIIAERRILKSLTIADFTLVIAALELDVPAVPRG
jgi:hypothetical protein